MRKSDWKHATPLVFCCWLSSAAAAATPVPSAKPLNEGQATSFVAGVDIPRSKPAPETVILKPGQSPRPQNKKCVLPGAQIVQKIPISGGLKGSQLDDDACGISDPVELQGVMQEDAKVAFPASVLVSCEFAQTVSDWLRQDVFPAARAHFDSPLALIGSGPGYQCRRRNNLPEGKLSEHALGKALDISYFELRNGSTISVEKDWSENSAKGLFLKDIHAAACERFTTVLGPDADPSHRSHIHLDIGCHGQDCTYVICQ